MKVNNMVTPNVDELTQHNKYNRYTLVIAVAKCARQATEEYVEQRENAERVLTGSREGERSLASLIERDFRDKKAVRIGVDRLFSGEYRIVDDSIDVNCNY